VWERGDGFVNVELLRLALPSMDIVDSVCKMAKAVTDRLASGGDQRQGLDQRVAEAVLVNVGRAFHGQKGGSEDYVDVSGVVEDLDEWVCSGPYKFLAGAEKKAREDGFFSTVEGIPRTWLQTLGLTRDEEERLVQCAVRSVDRSVRSELRAREWKRTRGCRDAMEVEEEGDGEDDGDDDGDDDDDEDGDDDDGVDKMEVDCEEREGEQDEQQAVFDLTLLRASRRDDTFQELARSYPSLHLRYQVCPAIYGNLRRTFELAIPTCQKYNAYHSLPTHPRSLPHRHNNEAQHEEKRACRDCNRVLRPTAAIFRQWRSVPSRRQVGGEGRATPARRCAEDEQEASA